MVAWVLGMIGTSLAGPAPMTTPYGLALGQADAPAVEAWLAERELSCPATASPRRTTMRWECGAVPAAVIADREVGPGRVEGLLLARLDDGPVHHLSTRRAYEAPADARTDYATAVQRLTALLGAPISGVAPPDDAAFTRAVAHASTRWSFDDLVVEVTLHKAGGSGVSVSERWDVPGAAARAVARPRVEVADVVQ